MSLLFSYGRRYLIKMGDSSDSPNVFTLNSTLGIDSHCAWNARHGLGNRLHNDLVAFSAFEQRGQRAVVPLLIVRSDLCQ